MEKQARIEIARALTVNGELSRRDMAKHLFRSALAKCNGAVDVADDIVRIYCHLQSKTIGEGILKAHFDDGAKFDAALASELGATRKYAGRKAPEVKLGAAYTYTMAWPEALSAEQRKTRTPRCAVATKPGRDALTVVWLDDGHGVVVAHAATDDGKQAALALAARLAPAPAPAPAEAPADKPAKRTK